MTNGQDDTMNQDWRARGFDANMQRASGKKSPFFSGEGFDSKLDEMMFNRVIQFKNLDQAPQGNDTGKVYYDPVNKKLMMWVGGAAKWVELTYTSTSTTTTSSSTSTTI